MNLARRLLASVAHGDGRFYAPAAIGFAAGLGLMAAAVILTRNQTTFSPPSPWRSSVLIIAGQVVASAAGVVALIPRTRRRKREADLKAGRCPPAATTCGRVPTAAPNGERITRLQFQTDPLTEPAES